MATAALIGCGGEDGGEDGGGDTPAPVCIGPEMHDCVWAVAGDFRGTGVLSAIELGLGPGASGPGDDGLDPAVEIGAIAGVVSDDPVVRSFAGMLYVVNRFGSDNVAVIDLATRSLIAQISTGPRTNPQDVMVYGQMLYVVALGAPGVLMVDLDRPDDGVIGMIDLTELDPDDGGPDCHAIERVDNHLYVSCGILDERFQPRGPGKIAVIQLSPDDPLSAIKSHELSLESENPSGRLQAMPSPGPLAGELVIATVDFSGLADNDLTRGCLERIRAVDGDTEPAALGCLVDNSILGGYVNAYVAEPGTDTMHLVVTEGYGPNGALSHLTTFYVQDRAVAQTPATPANQAPIDIVRCPSGAFAIADAATGGVRIYDPIDDDDATDAPAGVVLAERTTGVLDIGLPPVERGLVCVSGSTLTPSTAN